MSSVRYLPRSSINADFLYGCSLATISSFILLKFRKCVDVPKEVCVLVRTNPRKVKRPLVKKWCGPDPNVSFMLCKQTRYVRSGN